MLIKYLRLVKKWFKEYVSICPPLPKKYRDNSIPFIVCGHRGSPANQAENTIPSFQQALDDGANAIEIDLSLTMDGHVVLWHDWDPNETKALLREAGLEPELKYKPHPPPLGSFYRKPTNELTLEEFRKHFTYRIKTGDDDHIEHLVPTLEDLFGWCCNDDRLKLIFFDIKTPPEAANLAPELLKKVLEMIEKHKPKQEIIYESFDLNVFLAMKRAFPECKYSLDVEPPPGFIIDPKKYSAVKMAVRYKNEYAIAFRPRKLTIANWTTFRRIVRHDLKFRYKYNKKSSGHCVERIVGCTINKSKQMRCLVKLGIDGLQTDFPGRLRKIVDSYGRKLL